MKTRTILLTFLACSAALSCTQGKDDDQPKYEKVTFDASMASETESRGTAADVETRTFAADLDGLTVTMTSVPGINLTGFQEPDTRGTLYNTSGSSKNITEYGFTGFKACGYNGDGSAFIPKYTNVVTDGKTWGTSDRDYYWKVSDSKSFFAYLNLPASGASVDCNTTAQTLTLSSFADDASSQFDILMAAYKSSSSEVLNKVPLVFSHPMTAVIFKKGDLDGISTIKSITMEGVYASGTAVQSVHGSISWTPGASKKTVSQSGGLAVSASNEVGEPFILIPQTLSSTNPVTVTIVLNDGTKDISTKCVINSGEWQYGHTNNYTIEYRKPNLSVAVNYTESERGVSDLTMTKTGIKAYVRAVALGRVMKNHTNLLQSTFELSSYDTDHWEKGSDGFYYYKDPVSAEKDSHGVVSAQTTSLYPLFTSAAFPLVASGLVCQMNVVMQAVQYTGQASCWEAFN